MNSKGLVHLYFGDGKGKTTAAIGLGIRACGYGKNVLFVQFLKNFNTGEILAIDKINIGFKILKCEPVKKFVSKMNEEEKLKTFTNQHEMFVNAIELIRNEQVDVVIFDELIDALNLGIISKNEISDLIKTKPPHLEIVITGHNPENNLFELFDYITEMKKVKHPYDKGIKARKGIEK